MLAAAALLSAAAAAAPRHNVLMIAIDDQRPELGCYGAKHMHTPNYDRLAQRSLLFERAYIQVALCSPSRTSLLTSRRPDTSKVWDITPTQYWRETGGNFTTLPQWFKEQGYNTWGMGKVFHEGAPSRNQDIKYSWSPECVVGHDGDQPGTALFEGSTTATAPHNGTKKIKPCLWKYDTDDDDKIADGALARHAAAALTNLSAAAKPFFLAVGFHKPHVAWEVPAKYWDLYPDDSIQLAPHQLAPANVPPVAMQTVIVGWAHGRYSDLAEMVKTEPFAKDFPLGNTTLPAWKARQIRQAYWAATSFTDRNIGVVLDALDASPAKDNTVVALWGDHGYQLGDNNMWAKQSNFEHATRVPFMLHVPGMPAGRTSQLVEAIDLFPTLVEAAGGVKLPGCSAEVATSRKTDLCTEGFSLMQFVQNPAAAEWDRPAFSQYERENDTVMGYTMRTDLYRYTEWVKFDFATGVAHWDKLVARELYDHSAAPVQSGTPESWAMETVNVAEEPARQQLAAALSKQLRAGWAAR